MPLHEVEAAMMVSAGPEPAALAFEGSLRWWESVSKTMVAADAGPGRPALVELVHAHADPLPLVFEELDKFR